MAGTRAGDVAGEAATRLIFLDPARVARVIVTDFLTMKCRVRLYDQSSLEVTVPMSSPVWTTEYSGSAASADLWLNWSFDFYFRGNLEFSGPVVGGMVEEGGSGTFGQQPVAFARLQCVSWLVWLLGGRTIQSSTGVNWFKNTKPYDDILRDLVREQAVSGTVLTPSSWPGANSRSNFGPFTVSVEADTSSAGNGDFLIQTGKPLLDTALELCTTGPSDADYLWPYMVETSPTVFQCRVSVGRSGGSRGIGTDKSGSIYVLGSLGTVRSSRLSFDHLSMMSLAIVGGTGQGSGRARTFAHSASIYALVGDREDEVTIPRAAYGYERTNEALRALNESNSENTRNFEFQLLERSGVQYGVDFAMMDTITAGSTATGQYFAKMVIGVDIDMVSPAPATVKLLFGGLPRHSDREVGRSGGGGRGGGRKGGGRPRDSDGAPSTDPDTHTSWGTILTERPSWAASDLTADEMFDSLCVKGEGADDSYMHIIVGGSDPGSGTGTVEALVFTVHGVFISDDFMAPNGYVQLRGPAGAPQIDLAARQTVTTPGDPDFDACPGQV